MKGAKSGMYTKQTRKHYGRIESSACLSGNKYKFNNVALDQISKVQIEWKKNLHSIMRWQKSVYFHLLSTIDKKYVYLIIFIRICLI